MIPESICLISFLCLVVICCCSLIAVLLVGDCRREELLEGFHNLTGISFFTNFLIIPKEKRSLIELCKLQITLTGPIKIYLKCF